MVRTLKDALIVLERSRKVQFGAVERYEHTGAITFATARVILKVLPSSEKARVKPALLKALVPSMELAVDKVRRRQ